MSKKLNGRPAKPMLPVKRDPSISLVTPIAPSILYWAYGSNLSTRVMAHRCPGAVQVAPLMLDNGSLVFRGVADVTALNGSIVPGGLWRVTREQERALDRYEGIGTGLYRKRHLLLSINGEEKQAFYYVMSTRSGILPPSEPYLETITEGYQDFNLPLDTLAKAVQHSIDYKAPTQMLIERHARRGGKLATGPRLIGRKESK